MKNYEARIRKIPEHLVYWKEYQASRHLFFWDIHTGENQLQSLSDRVMGENPQIQLTNPDYNYFLYPEGWFNGERKRVVFCDRVTALGVDREDYQFRKIAEVTAVNVLHQGPFEELFCVYNFAMKWINNNGCRISGLPRDSFIHGFWDRDDPQEYLTEVQIPIEFTQ